MNMWKSPKKTFTITQWYQKLKREPWYCPWKQFREDIAQSSEISSWFNLQITELTVPLTRISHHPFKENPDHTWRYFLGVAKLHHQLCLIPRIIFGTIRVCLNEQYLSDRRRRQTPTWSPGHGGGGAGGGGGGWVHGGGHWPLCVLAASQVAWAGRLSPLSSQFASPVTAPWPGLASGDSDAPRPPRPERGLERWLNCERGLVASGHRAS